jgi:hypothetical protein
MQMKRYDFDYKLNFRDVTTYTTNVLMVIVELIKTETSRHHSDWRYLVNEIK